MKKIKKRLLIGILLTIIGGGVYVTSYEMKACNKCVINDATGERKCGKCGGFMEIIKNHYEDGYLYSTYECKNCKHHTSTKTKS